MVGQKSWVSKCKSPKFLDKSCLPKLQKNAKVRNFWNSHVCQKCKKMQKSEIFGLRNSSILVYMNFCCHICPIIFVVRTTRTVRTVQTDRCFEKKCSVFAVRLTLPLLLLLIY